MDMQVSNELIRMAILWHEQWHEALEEASRLYFGDSNVAGMLAILSPLHHKMQDAGPTTLKEIAFVSVRILGNACCTGTRTALHLHSIKAWIHSSVLGS